jgi:hypothetical protein
MGFITPNIGIYIPAAGETNYDSSFAAGMVNIDQHDHSGGPTGGVPLSSSGLADGSVTYQKLNPNVADNTTGIGTSGAAGANQLSLLGILMSIYQLTSPVGFLTANGTTANFRTFANSSSIVWTNANGVGGNPSAALASTITTSVTGTPNQIAASSAVAGVQTISLTPTVLNATQPCFLANIVGGGVSNVTGDGTDYIVPFTGTISYQRGGSNFNGNTTFTAPNTGVYYIHADLACQGITSGMNQGEISIFVNGAQVYSDFNGNVGAVMNSGGGFVLSINQPALLTAGDLVTIHLRIFSGAKVVSIADGTFSVNLLY